MRGILSFTLIGFFLLCLEVFATEIPAGPVFGDWYASGNPYNVNGEIIIPMDSTLNIHPGVQIIFQGHYKFIINGILEANGVEGDSILFTAADTTTGWHSLRFLSAQDTSHLSYCVIQYGRAPGTADPDAQGGGICCYYSNIVVSHCTVRRNYAQWCAAGILLDNSASIVDSCNIIGNYTDGGAGGILVRYDPPGATIRNCIIADNIATAVGGGGGGIFLLYAHDVNINDCQILNNEGYHEGGGILVLGSTATISGCEISGNSTYNTNFWGGGGIAVCDISTAEIRNCTVTNNIAPNWIGGGISVGSSQATISDCEIAFNTSDQGGGMNIQGSEVTLTGCDIHENNSTTGGGGIFVYAYNYQVDISMSSCTVVANVASGGGGGIRFYNAGYQTAATLQNCVIAANHCTANGGGISDNNFNLTIDQSTFSGNSSGSLGAEIFITNVYPTISNTIVEGSSGNSSIHFSNALYTLISYCDVFNNAGANFGGSVPPGLGDLIDVNGCGDSCDIYMNIFMDPLFRDPANGDYRLQSMTDPQCGYLDDSPCIDAGNPNILDSLLDCSWGLGTTLSDMGAYGGGDSVDVRIGEHLPQIPRSFALYQNYPNPFNASTTIGYDLPKASEVTIDIYDILGLKVQRLIRENQRAGQHSVVWNADGLSSGMYFYRIKAGEYTETKKMLLLK